MNLRVLSDLTEDPIPIMRTSLVGWDQEGKQIRVPCPQRIKCLFIQGDMFERSSHPCWFRNQKTRARRIEGITKAPSVPAIYRKIAKCVVELPPVLP